MTKAQQRAVYQLRDVALHVRGRTPDQHEIKSFKVDDDARGYCPLVFVSVEIGLKNDEGTMASLLCRDRLLIAVGPRGALRVLNAVVRYNKRTGRKTTGRVYVRTASDAMSTWTD